MIDRFFKLTSIDFHIGVTLLYRLWTIMAGGVLLIIVPLYMSENQQGYYFTFASIIGLQVFFELGFNYVISQMISHEMAHLNIENKRVIKGREVNLNRLHSLLIMLKKWYICIAVMFFVIVLPIGIYFFCENPHLSMNEWLPAWTLIVIFTAMNLFISPFLSVLEGMGFVGDVALIRLVQSVIGYSLFFVFLILGYSLISVPFISGSAVIISAFYVFFVFRKLLFINAVIKQENKISWKKEIFPFQWRIALSWLSGYFIFQLFTPILFIHQGAVEAGKLGLTLQIFTTLLTLSMSWMNAKGPIMGRLIAINDRVSLNSMFISLLIKSTLANVILSTLFIFFYMVLKKYGFNFVDRISSLDVIYTLAFTTFMNHIIFSMALYMRAHKKEPMLSNSITVGALTVLSILYFSRESVIATIASYSLIITLVCFPWCCYLFIRYFKMEFSHGK
ncbi:MULTISPECIES: oligosaccharide flippase family protein [Citrobacter]|jgi:hypothetical protein|uniref:oligosaccharide flippase family protein n=1 Tax=Citrobacter sp. wls718 TaxID=2576418 RepID=UPI000E1B8235|nr:MULTISPECIES: oligosaccharide flippase family protein [Citrobacter]QMJ04079.1 oligosaccharide flippase family protein [Citrobacter freundii]QMJ13147.1 oligosaccharide flippase family protein [Citrobacter freundii]TKU34460.1 hypothetical protein FDW95_06000 [Citrobacter sp. wls718]